MDEQDPTKARWYVAVDLAIKSISAIGLIVLGIAEGIVVGALS